MERDIALAAKGQLVKARDKTKKLANKNRTGREFDEGYLVYLRL